MCWARTGRGPQPLVPPRDGLWSEARWAAVGTGVTVGLGSVTIAKPPFPQQRVPLPAKCPWWWQPGPWLWVLWAQKTAFSSFLGHSGEIYTSQIRRNWRITLKTCKFVIKDTTSLRTKLIAKWSVGTVWGALDPSHSGEMGAHWGTAEKPGYNNSWRAALLNSQAAFVHRTCTRTNWRRTLAWIHLFPPCISFAISKLPSFPIPLLFWWPKSKLLQYFYLFFLKLILSFKVFNQFLKYFDRITTKF